MCRVGTVCRPRRRHSPAPTVCWALGLSPEQAASVLRSLGRHAQEAAPRASPCGWGMRSPEGSPGPVRHGCPGGGEAFQGSHPPRPAGRTPGPEKDGRRWVLMAGCGKHLPGVCGATYVSPVNPPAACEEETVWSALATRLRARPRGRGPPLQGAGLLLSQGVAQPAFLWPLPGVAENLGW